MTALTDQQKAKIAENKRKALEKLEQRKAERSSLLSNISSGTIPKKQKLNENAMYSGPEFQAKGNHPMFQENKVQSRASHPIQAVATNRLMPGVQANQSIFPANEVQPRENQPRGSQPAKVLVSNRSVNAGPSTSETFNPLADYTPKVILDLEVISSTEISIDFKPYIDVVKNFIQSFKSAKFNQRQKKWTIGFPDHNAFSNGLKTLKGAKCTVNGLPKWVDYVFNDKNSVKKSLSQIDVEACLAKSKIDDCLLKKLFPYQRAGVAFGLEREGRLLIADEMGLGKSLQALSIASAFSSEWPLLIVCPASVKYSWKQQIRQFLPSVTNVTVIEKTSDRLPSGKEPDVVIIMSYDLMVIKEKELDAERLRVIIFDESHLLKQPTTKRTKIAMELAKHAKRKILLSGTPALSRPCELFSQVRIIDPKIFTNFNAFALRYCDYRRGSFGMEAKGATNLNELSAILKYAIMIRRLKKDVLNDLPAKTREILYLSGDKIKTQMNALKKSREAYNDAEEAMDADKMRSTLMTYYADTGICKSEPIADYIIETYFGKESTPIKLLLFAHHTAVLDLFSRKFSTKGINFIRIDGHTKGPDREANCKKFQEDPNVKIAVLSITAAGTGITLTAANKVIFAELYWNPGTFFQAEDRAHRVGQKSAVFIQYILARGTADDVIWPKIQEKIMVVGNLSLTSDKLDKLEEQERIIGDGPKITDYFTILEI